MEEPTALDLDALTAYPPLSELSPGARAELHELAAAAGSLEDLPGKWQAAVLEAGARRAGNPAPAAGGHCCGA